VTTVDDDTESAGEGEEASARLCFEIGGIVFGVEPDEVLEIIDLPEVTRLPKSPSHVLGLVNWRSRPLPLVSFARFVGLPERERTPEQQRDRPDRVLVVTAADMTVALEVDRVRSIELIPSTSRNARVALPTQLEPYAKAQSDLGSEVMVDFALPAFLERSRVRS